MNKIGKNYLKSFIKDKFMILLISLYLIAMFALLFYISSLSFQDYYDYAQINNNSFPWKSNYAISDDNSDLNWNISNIGNDISKKNKSDDFFDFLNTLKDTNGNFLLTQNEINNTYWYKTIYTKQLGLNWNSSKNYVNLSKSETVDFDKYLNYDIKTFLLFSEEKNKNWSNEEILYKKNNEVKLKYGEIFNSNVNWYDLKFSLQKIILESLANNNKQLAYNESLVIDDFNYGSKANVKNNETQILNCTFVNNDYRKNMSEVFLEKNNTKIPTKNNDILVNEQFANNNNWKIGDKIQLFGNNFSSNNLSSQEAKKLSTMQFTITGFAISLSTSHSDSIYNTLDSSNYSFGNIYFTYNEYNKIKHIIYNEMLNEKNIFDYTNDKMSWCDKNKNTLLEFYFSRYSLLSNIDSEYNDITQNIYTNNYILNNDFTNNFQTWKNTIIYSSISSEKGKIIIDIAIFFCVGLFSTIFINLTIKRDINNSKKELGIFKAMGYKTNELAWIYTYKVLISFFISAIIGYLISIPLQIKKFDAYVVKQRLLLTVSNYNHNILFLIIMMIFIPIFFGIFVTFLMNLFNLKLTPIQLIYDTDKAKNLWISNVKKKIIKKEKSKLINLKSSFTIQNIWKWLLISLIFSISLTTVIINISSNNGIRKYYINIYSQYYSSKINSEYSINNISNYNIKKDNIDGNNYFITNYDINNNDYNDLKSFDVKDINDINVKNDINKSIHEWHNYPKENPNVNPINNINIKIYPYVRISDLWTYIQQSKNYKNLTELINQLSYIKYNSKTDTIICLNNLVNSMNTNFYSLSNQISSLNLIQKMNINACQILGFDDRSNYSKFENFWNSSGISKEDYNEVCLYDNDKNEIPVIIPELLAYKMNWKKGMIINNFSIWPNENDVNNKSISNINLKIVAIANYNAIDDTIYTGYKNLAKFYKDKENNQYCNSKTTNYSLLNEDISETNYYPNIKNIQGIYNSWMNFKNNYNLNTDKINDLDLDYFYIITTKDSNYLTKENLTLSKYLQYVNDKSISIDYTNLFSYTYVKQLVNSTKDGIKIKNKTDMIQTSFILFITAIIIAVSILLIIDEQKKYIILLKLLGYENWKINWISFGNIIMIIGFSFFSSIMLSKLILFTIIKYFKLHANTLVSMPLVWNNIFILFIFTTIFLFIIWKISMNIIKKYKIQELIMLE